jgi:hypothetical protein
MFRKAGELLVQGYFLLLTVAVGGFVGANFAVFVPVIAEIFFNPSGRATQPATYLRWIHAGWLVGAAFALVGSVLQRRRSMQRKSRTEHHSATSAEAVTTPRGVLASAGVGALCCGLLGAMLGGSFLLLWFSLAYSPFSPNWDRTIAVERDRTFPQRSGHWVHTTTNPIALGLFFGPMVAGAASGAVLGGVSALRRKWHTPGKA